MQKITSNSKFLLRRSATGSRTFAHIAGMLYREKKLLFTFGLSKVKKYLRDSIRD